MTTPSRLRPDSTALPESAPHTGARFAGLDGLRALAVIAVIVYHCFPGLLPGGFIGVDVFFVISGFLITRLLVAEHERHGRIDLGRFWQRRARRLLPALITVVVVCCTTAWLIGGDVLVSIGRQVLGAATFSSNWLDIAAGGSYFARDTPELFRNLWSLAVEEQFYLLWPVLVIALLFTRRRWLQILLVSALALASATAMAALFHPGSDATRVYFGSDTHSFGLAVGAALAFMVAGLHPVDLNVGERRTQRFIRQRFINAWLPTVGVVSLIGVCTAAWWLHDDADATYRGGLLLTSLLTALVIWAAVTPRSRLGRALDVTPLRVIGERSYGLYLWHWPVLLLVTAALPSAAGTSAAGSSAENSMQWLAGGVTVLLTVVAASVSYRFIEQPIRRHGLRGAARLLVRMLRGSHPRRPVWIAAGIVAVLCFGGTVAAVASAPHATTAEQFVERGQQAIADPQAPPTPPATPGAATAVPSPGADPTSPPGGPDDSAHPVHSPLPTGDQITAIGDSVMLASAPELQTAFPGISIDAVVSRQMHTAPAIVRAQADAHTLRSIVLIGLGTNGAISAGTLAELQKIAGPQRRLVFLTVQAPRGWTPEVNATLTEYAATHRRHVALADWQNVIAPHIKLLADDEIHPGSAGGRIYAGVVRDALQRLVDIPPPHRYDDSPALPRPR
jgi:peptidoglycan/LPS O-acetylase OafA/YrhL